MYYPLQSFCRQLSFLVSFLFLFGGFAIAQTAISPTTWTGQGTSASGPSIFTTLPASATPGSTAVVVSQWNRGSALTSSSASSTYSSANFAADLTSAAAQAANRYVYFTVTNNTSTEVNVTQVFISSQISSTGPRNAGMLYRIGSGTVTSFGTDVITNHNSSPESWTFNGNVTICPGNTTTFYLCGYGSGTASTGTFRVNNNSSITASYTSALSVTASASSPVCETDTVYFTGTAGSGVTPYTYSWSGPGSFTSTALSPYIALAPTTASGTYSLTVTDAYNCSSVKTATLVVNPNPTAITGATSVCVGLSVGLTDASTGGTWSSSNTNVTVVPGTGVVTGVAAGTSTITYALSTGCKTTTTQTVNAAPAAITGASNVCTGNSITLSNATSGGTWSSGSTNVTVGPTSGSVTGISAGSATITYMLSSGCYSIAAVTIDPIPSAITGPSNVCETATVTLSNASTGGTWSSSNTNSSVGSLSGIVTGLVSGTSTISYTSSAGCYTITTVTIDPAPAPITGTFSVCETATTLLSDAITGGTWSSGNTNSSVSPSGVVTGLIAGTSTISYTVGSGCYATTIVSVDPMPASILGVDSVCTGLTTTLSNAITGGAWTSGTSSVATVGVTTGIVTGASAGTSIIYYVIGAGCTASVTVTVNALPSAISGPASLCLGTSVTMSDAVAGGSWSCSNTNVSVGSSSGSVTGLNPGTSVLTYTLSTGCEQTATITVNTIPAAITGDTSVCTTLTASVSNSISGGTWSSSNSNISIGSISGAISGISSGTSVISYALSSGCTATTTFTVYALPGAVSGASDVCAGASTTLSNPVAGGTWTSSNTNATIGSSSGIVSGMVPGSATITYSTGPGCSAVSTITVSPLPSSISGPLAVCVGAGIALSDASSGGTWSSSNTNISIGSLSGAVTGVNTGTSTVTYALATGCYATRLVSVNPVPAAISGLTSVCSGLSTGLSNSVGAGTWSSVNTTVSVGSSTGMVAGLVPGTATVTYTLGSGCSVTAVVTVNVTPAAIAGALVLCAGSSTNLSNSTGGGTWSSSNTNISIGSSSGLVTGVSAGTSTVSYSLSSGCAASATFTVNTLPSSISGTSALCVGSVASLSSTPGGGSWSSSSTSVSVGSLSGLVSALATGTASISYTLSTGCLSSTVLTVNPLPAGITGSGQVCVTASVLLSDATSGGTWSSSNTNLVIGSISGNVTGMVPGTSVVSYTLSTGCYTTKVMTVSTMPAPVSGTATVCTGATTGLSDLLGGGVWTSSNTNLSIGSSSGIVTGLLPGTATISYTLGGACVVTTTATVNPTPMAITGIAAVCAGSATNLSDATPGGTWSSSNTNATVGVSSGLVSGITAGTAVISYAMTTGCYTSVVLSVNATPAPITGIMNVCTGSTTTLSDATPSGSWSSSSTNVSIGSGSGIANGISAGTATISYSLSTGCHTTSIVTVYLSPSAISGSSSVCSGAMISLSDAVAGGSWSSSNSNVSIGSTSGSVTGMAVGTSTISYVLGTGCMVAKTFTVDPLPLIHTVTGGGSYCAGDTGVHIKLNTSDVGVSYQLYNGATPVGTTKPGIGAILDLGLVTAAGTYTVVATNPSTTCSSDMAGSAIVSITPVVVPAITLSKTTPDTICAGTTVSFLATPVNEGLSPVYKWYVNGILKGATGTMYSYKLMSTDVVSVVLTSSATCAVPATVSFTDTVNVLPGIVSSINVSQTPSGVVCLGSSVTFNAVPVNGGSSPFLKWIKNGVTVAVGAGYSYTPTDGDIVNCALASSMKCVVSDTVYSGLVTIDVDTPTTPTVTIVAHPGIDLSVGQADTLTAVVTSGGKSPSFQWLVNGSILPGSTGASLIMKTLMDGDSVSCIVTNTDPCGLSSSSYAIVHMHNEGVAPASLKGDIRIFPNPSDGEIVIEGSIDNDGNEAFVRVCNAVGQVVYQRSLAINSGHLHSRISLKDVPSGVYLVTLSSSGIQYIDRIIIAK